MNRRKKIGLFVFIALAFALLCVSINSYILVRSSDRIVAQWEQPASVKNDPLRQFRLIVVQSSADWSEFPYSQNTYKVYIGDDYPYGNWYRFPFYYHQKDIESTIKNSTVEWSVEGVTFKTNSGERLFIPKDVIVAGRS